MHFDIRCKRVLLIAAMAVQWQYRGSTVAVHSSLRSKNPLKERALPVPEISQSVAGLRINSLPSSYEVQL